MRLSFSALTLSSGLLAFISPAHAGEFVSAVPDYTEGTFATVGGTHYTDTSGAVGQPSPIVGAGTAFAGILSPFEAHYQTDQLVAIGRGGTITLQFAQPMAVTGSPQIGIFTKISLLDMDYPNGSAGAVATTDAMGEFGAERTAVVEVASHANDFHSLGRVFFDDPTNYYANATSPYQFPSPSPAQLASFDKPFIGSPSDFNNDSFSGILSQLDGSAGGTWISVPTNLGLSDIQFVRLSDPLWRLPDGTLVDQRESIYFPPPNAFVKPADLFVDGAVLIPEPAALATFALLALVLRRRS